MNSRHWILAAAIVFATHAAGQADRREPHIGYVYPAGARQGSTVEVLVGGQALGGASGVYISGGGVEILSVTYAKPLNNDQLKELRTYVTALTRKLRKGAEAVEAVETTSDLLGHPMLRGLDKMTLPELEHWTTQFLNAYKQQRNPQLAELAAVRLRIGADAKPGDRELRVAARGGISNPLRFQVSILPEVSEHEPNDQSVFDKTALAVPVILNGQILAGDADRFRIRGKAGSVLIIRAQARNLMPYLADAVPGWFQAALTVYDVAGKEWAFADHYRFEPDPVIFFKVPRDAEYEIEIRDTLYRGRHDFVYRVSVGAPLKEFAAPQVEDSSSESAEIEPNDIPEQAQALTLPQVAAGCIARPGDVDVYQFAGHAGEDVVAEISARRLGSPLDSLVRLMDGSGRIIEWNDDCLDKGAGLLTHHADSYLRTRLTADGTYFLRVADTQHAGGEAYAYRLRVGAPQPDFALRIAPSSINVAPGRFAVFAVHALRKDGFDGDIEVTLKDAPAGFALNGGVIPRGRDSVRMTLTAPPVALDGPVELHLEGRAEIDGQGVVHPAVPAEDMMQAFAYRHLVPSQQLLVSVLGAKRGATIVQLADSAPVRIPAGGEAKVIVRTPASPMLAQVRLEPVDPAPGITLEGPTVVSEGLCFSIKSSNDAPGVGYRDNLIVQANLEPPAEAETAEPKGKRKKPTPYGVLPAIAYEVVSK